MAIQYADKKDIPADEAGDFVEWKETDGTIVHLHKDYAESKKTNFKLQGDVTQLTTDAATTKTKLEGLTAAETKRAAEAETKRTEGLTELERQNEVIADLRKRQDSSDATHKTEIDGLKSAGRSKEKAVIVTELGGMATEANREILRRMVSADIDLQADGSILIIGSDGKATSQTFDEYKAGLKEKYPSLVAAVQSKGGIGKGGAGGEGGTKTKHGTTIPGFSALPVN